ncbi:MAG: PQQ-binding-like beta-propeller repeat protein [Planctomycetota bacterium]|nr:PQQ-binding-like beta-propeller repeat protein [Planctomycetota bacterium]
MTTRFHAVVAFILSLCVHDAVSTAADIEVRLVAADESTKPLVSELVDFRRSPDGGLIAVQWVSGVLLDGKSIFPVRSDGIAIPNGPKVAGSPTKSATSDLNDLLGDINKKKTSSKKLRPVDVVDEQYREAKLSDGRKIGPVRRRTSAARVVLSKSASVSPGSLSLAKDGRIDVACYPVTITAARVDTGERDVFVPRLSYEGRDLLADCLFEHSPDVPLGDESAMARGNAQGQLGWLNATRGGNRDFRRLTIYLPANGRDTAYRLNGQEFHVSSAGVGLVQTADAHAKATVKSVGKFQLQTHLPAVIKPTLVPIVASVGGGWSLLDQSHAEFDVTRRQLAPITLKSARREVTLQPRLPDGERASHRFVQVVAMTEDAEPVVRLVEMPLAADTTKPRFAVRITQTNAGGADDLPQQFAAELLPNVGSVDGSASLRNAGKSGDMTRQPIAIEFTRSAANTWTSSDLDVSAGLYGLRLGLAPQANDVLPIVIANQSRGSVSLATYHNRNDFLRGETAHLGVITRGLREVSDVPLLIKLTHENGETTVVAKVIAASPAGSARSQFVAIDTGGLRLGRYVISIGNPEIPDHALIAYDTSITVHAAKPKSNFAVYSWFANSFSGPMKAGDKTLVNILLSQKPTGPLTPAELARYTRQPTFPSNLRSTFASDPLYPSPETTIGYDEETEREMAVAMRLGIKYCPDYGWGMNGQEAAWNPKHTLPEELKRIQRLCSQVTQRFRDFGNFGGLHLNWYPRLGGNWEQHPATDGNAVPRRELLQKQAEAVYAETAEDKASATGGLDRAVRAHKHRVGAFARAYDAWTSRARTMSVGFPHDDERDQVRSHLQRLGLLRPNGLPLEGLISRLETTSLNQPGLDGRHVYTSFPPISWFQQRNYYPSTYHATLPVSAVHAYTDYGFSPFQPLWGVDHWAARFGPPSPRNGNILGKQPVWATTMSNGRDIMLRHALLLAGRGADGIDIKGQDDRTAGVISDFLQSYGPFFRAMQPKSDVAIITSLRQQFSTKELIGQWMGYTGGKYFDLYVKLWYARRPPHMLAEDDVTLDRLKNYKAVFILGQQVRMPPSAMMALADYDKSGGRVFKDADTADVYPGTTFSLLPAPIADSNRPAWDTKKYSQTRDQFFVGTQAGYEAIAASLDKLLGELPPPRVHSSGHDVLLATMEPPSIESALSNLPPPKGPRVAAAVFAVNDKRTPPGIEHPWNFWSATILSSRSTLTFDKPYVLYDLLEAGREIQLQRLGDRFVHPVTFDRCSGRAYIATTSPIRSLNVKTDVTAYRSATLRIEVKDDQQATFVDALPFEFTVVDEAGNNVQTIYRALGPESSVSVPLPGYAKAGTWSVRVRELASGMTAIVPIKKLVAELPIAAASPVLMPRAGSVSRFLKDQRPGQPPVLIVLDQRQLDAHGKAIQELANQLAGHIHKSGRSALVRIVAADDVVQVPQRWRPTATDRLYLTQARAGQRTPTPAAWLDGDRKCLRGLNDPEPGQWIIAAGDLATKHFRTATGAAGALDAIHPASGWTEPGAVHRIYQDVVILGSMSTHRLVSDLHRTVGMRAEPGFPADGSALVQVIHDAFTADHDCLSIQAPDLDGLRAGVKAIASIGTADATDNSKPVQAADVAANGNDRVVSVTRTEKTALPNPIRDVFGAAVHPMGFSADGGLLASAGTQASNYFLFDEDGNLQRKWLGKYAVEPDSLNATNADGIWIREWWGTPGFVDSIVRADKHAKPKWMMNSPRYSRGFAGWRHPGTRFLVDRSSGDIFVSGHNRLTRITTDGTVVWRYDDLETTQDVESFRFSRDIMLHGLSDDGRFVLAAAFGVEPYANVVNKFVRPTVMLFDTATGKVVWEKKDVLIDHSACGFASSNLIVVADATPGRKRIVLLDMSGKEVWSQARPQGTSQAVMTPEGSWLIVRPEAPRGTNFQTLGPPKGLFSISLADKTPTASANAAAFQLSADIHAWRMVQSDGRILVSTVDGWLRCFQPDTKLEWEQRFNGPVNILTSFSGDRIAIGTQNGLLLRLDENGKVLQQIDLMPHNMVIDQAKYVRDYTASPADTPLIDATPALPPRIHQRHGKIVRFSPNLWPVAGGKQILRSSKTISIANAKPGTYLLSLLQRALEGKQSTAPERIVVEVRQGKVAAPIYSAPIEASATWQERTLSWKLAKSGAITITLNYTGATGIELHDSGLFTINYPSPNVLVQRLPDAPGVAANKPALNDLDSLLDGGNKKIVPPAVRFFMPNDVDLTARSRGATPFRQAIPYTVPFDGQLSGQKTSWLNKPITGSTHAQLQLSFESPVALSAFAVYEDTAAGYTDTYAIFCRDAKTQTWHRVGHATNNRSPFNVFSFPAIETDSVTYLWLKSADRHARIAELEGYRGLTANAR